MTDDEIKYLDMLYAPYEPDVYAMEELREECLRMRRLIRSFQGRLKACDEGVSRYWVEDMLAEIAGDED